MLFFNKLCPQEKLFHRNLTYWGKGDTQHQASSSLPPGLASFPPLTLKFLYVNTTVLKKKKKIIPGSKKACTLAKNHLKKLLIFPFLPDPLGSSLLP